MCDGGISVSDISVSDDSVSDDSVLYLIINGMEHFPFLLHLAFTTQGVGVVNVT